MMKTANAAKNLGVKVVNGFTGSKIWPLLYSFPPVSDAQISSNINASIAPFAPPIGNRLPRSIASFGSVVGLPFRSSAQPSGIFSPFFIAIMIFPRTTVVDPDPATYTDSYPTTATVVYVVFTLRSGLTGKVTLTMTRSGSPVIKPVSLNITVADGWSDFHIDSSSGFPVGDYAGVSQVPIPK